MAMFIWRQCWYDDNDNKNQDLFQAGYFYYPGHSQGWQTVQLGQQVGKWNYDDVGIMTISLMMIMMATIMIMVWKTVLKGRLNPIRFWWENGRSRENGSQVWYIAGMLFICEVAATKLRLISDGGSANFWTPIPLISWFNSNPTFAPVG